MTEAPRITGAKSFLEGFASCVKTELLGELAPKGMGARQPIYRLNQ